MTDVATIDGEGDDPHQAIEHEVDLERLFELMLEAEVPMPEEAGYGHGV